MISKTMASSILNHICGSKELSGSKNVYLGLCATEPTAAGAVSDEPSAASYARKKVTETISGSIVVTSFSATTSDGIITNKEEIMMNAAREAWGTMNYFFLSTSLVKGQPAFLWGKLYDKTGVEGITIGAETVPVFYEGQLRASIDVELPPITQAET